MRKSSEGRPETFTRRREILRLVWHEDPAKARKFSSDVLGWKMNHMPENDYAFVEVAGRGASRALISGGTTCTSGHQDSLSSLPAASAASARSRIAER